MSASVGGLRGKLGARRGRRGRGRPPLHQLALCSLFDTRPAATSAFLRQLKVAMAVELH